MKKPLLYTYRQKLFFSFIILFTSVIIVVSVFQHFYERRLRTEQLQENLINYANIIANALPLEQEALDQFSTLFPKDLRITIIKRNGEVIYDNIVEEYDAMENHIDRPEIKLALKEGVGFNIRFSNTLQQEYYYVAITSGKYLIRTSMASTIDLENT